jgi:predicted nucleic acid-binding protein
MIAPALFSLELRNILLAAERQGRIAAADVDLELSAIASFVETTPAPDEAALVQVLRLARGHGLNVYDASYLHLAVSRTATLASRDGALVNVCTRAGVQALDLR